jgi:hypothetical protein
LLRIGRILMNDNSSPDARLRRTLHEISQVMAGGGSADPDSLASRRADIDRTATLMIELYGEGALDRARLLEERPEARSFARSVCRRIEQLVAEPSRSLSSDERC